MAKTDETKPVEEAELIAKTEKVEEVVGSKKIEVKKNDASINIEKAKAIFEVMPHITSIFFSENGEWRFYPTPGAMVINKNEAFTK